MHFKILKSIILTTLILVTIKINSSAQIADSVLIKKLSINGICLCNTTVSALTQTNKNLKEVDVEEMDLPKNCFGQDSRFIAGKGLYSDKYPGMVFQKDQETDQISKIRLTKQFAGKLPDGNVIDMDKLHLKDVFKLYPKLKSTWGSRGCSNYWNFSDSTLSFYVKIDPNKKPQFPIDEAYYADKPIEAVDLVISCYQFRKEANEALPLDNPNDPVFFLDSIRVNRGVLKNYQPSELASVTVYKDTSAINRIGAEGKNGLIYFETKEFAKQRYWRFLSSKSSEYSRIVSDVSHDSSIQYILNNKVLNDNYEAELAAINDKNFKGLTIIKKAQLIKDYGIENKEYGVVIVCNVPVKVLSNK
jgi:hypothetical protein